MKILMTSVREDEKAAITAYATRTQIDIVTSAGLLEDNLEKLRDVDGIVIQQRSRLSDDVYAQLQIGRAHV